MKYLFTCVSILLFLTAFCQSKITDTTAINLITQIAAHNRWESETVGPDGNKSEQYARFESLKEKITNEQFFLLATTHKNGVVRAYGYFYCINNKEKIVNFDKLEKKLRKDKTKIFTVFGCLGRIHPINHFFSYDN